MFLDDGIRWSSGSTCSAAPGRSMPWLGRWPCRGCWQRSQTLTTRPLRTFLTRHRRWRRPGWRDARSSISAVIGVPGSAGWNPARQRDVIIYLIEASADPNAAAAGGVTPLHRAVRNRCSAAVGGPPARRCRPSPPKRPRLNRVRPRSLDNRARWHGLGSGHGRTTNHHRTTREHYRVRQLVRPGAISSYQQIAPAIDQELLP
jgi:hypothetical protein